MYLYLYNIEYQADQPLYYILARANLSFDEMWFLSRKPRKGWTREDIYLRNQNRFTLSLSSHFTLHLRSYFVLLPIWSTFTNDQIIIIPISNTISQLAVGKQTLDTTAQVNPNSETCLKNIRSKERSWNLMISYPYCICKLTLWI